MVVWSNGNSSACHAEVQGSIPCTTVLLRFGLGQFMFNAVSGNQKLQRSLVYFQMTCSSGRPERSQAKGEVVGSNPIRKMSKKVSVQY